MGESWKTNKNRRAGSNDAKDVDSAGTIVIENGMVLMVSSVNGKWSFPKGRIEPGECREETAIRETFEETGIRVALCQGFCYVVPSALPNDKRKVNYYLAYPIGGEIHPQFGEVFDAGWQPVEKVSELLHFQVDLPAFHAALEYIEKSLT